MTKNPVTLIPRQRTIFDILGVVPIEDQFTSFHAANPRVYAELVKAARQFRRQTGRTKCGMSLLIGRVRWVMALETDTVDGFKINNNFGAFYARLIMAQESDLAGMFDTRKALADRVTV